MTVTSHAVDEQQRLWRAERRTLRRRRTWREKLGSSTENWDEKWAPRLREIEIALDLVEQVKALKKKVDKAAREPRVQARVVSPGLALGEALSKIRLQ